MEHSPILICLAFLSFVLMIWCTYSYFGILRQMEEHLRDGGVTVRFGWLRYSNVWAGSVRAAYKRTFTELDKDELWKRFQLREIVFYTVGVAAYAVFFFIVLFPLLDSPGVSASK